jgi:hypothetical protein
VTDPPVDRGRAPRLVVVLSIESEGGLPRAWPDRVRRSCDAIVAVDHSGDAPVRRGLDADPLVEVIVPGGDGGEIGGIEAAVMQHADWVLVLDDGEQLDESDADALRTFLAGDAIAGCAYGLRAYRVARDGTHDPEPEWVFPLFSPGHGDRQHAPQVRTTFRIRRRATTREPEASTPWRAREPATPALLVPPVPADAGTGASWPVASARRSTGSVRLVCLLPARNCAHDLPGWFTSVSPFVDAVVALDDGSTDDTYDQLAIQPLVRILERNPTRTSYAGWDDGANRNQLLHAAGALEPDWIVSIDADERIPADDFAALRHFVDRDALPGYAYGFSRYRMIDDLEHYDRIEQRAWRLFAYEPAARFPDGRLHRFPIPTNIPRDRWLRTSVRIQHLASLTESRRAARWSKFQEADPDCRWERDYAYTRAAPGERRRWIRRPAGLPVLAASPDAERRIELEIGASGADPT